MQYRNPYYQAPQTAPQAIDETADLSNAREFIKEKLYFISVSRLPAPVQNVHFFTIDQQFVYTNFYADFGPSNMSHVVRFCNFMQQKFDVN
jgi:cell division cycle 14